MLLTPPPQKKDSFFPFLIKFLQTKKNSTLSILLAIIQESPANQFQKIQTCEAEEEGHL